MEGFHYLFHPVSQRLHELLDSGELGDLRHVEAMVATSGVDEWLYADLEFPGGATGTAR